MADLAKLKEKTPRCTAVAGEIAGAATTTEAATVQGTATVEATKRELATASGSSNNDVINSCHYDTRTMKATTLYR